MLTHRERVLAALNHQTPDRIPVDIAGTGATQINFDAYNNLKAYLGLDPGPTRILSRRSHLAVADDEILRRLDVDCRGIRPPGPDRSPERDLPDGSIIDNWGVTWAKPAKGHYYVKEPVFTGDLTANTLSQYDWSNPDDPGYVHGLRNRAQSLHEETDYFVVLDLPVGFGHQAQFMRGYDSWLMDLADDMSAAEALADAVLDVWMAISRNLLRACSPYIDGIYYADDIAFQHGPMMRREMFLTYLKPRLKRIFDMIREESDAKIIFHSCGSVVSVIPDLIEIGIDSLNPVQVSADGMDTAFLKKEYGKDLAFWGAIDTQHVLPFGTPDDVRKEVKRRVANLADSGGYVVASVHNIQAEVPPENIVAMVEAAHSL